MRAPVLLLLVLAVGLGFGTIQFARNWLESERNALTAMQQDEPAPELAVSRVLVTAGDMPSGHFLRAGDLRWQEWPEEAISEQYFTERDVQLEELVGAVVRSGMNSGEPITSNRVVRPGDRGFLAGVLTPGMRAMSVPVNETTGIAGLVFPGDRVDLILSHGVVEETEEKATKRTVSETVLTNRRVLAIDQMVDDLANEPAVADNVTLELTPREVEQVTVLLGLGSLTLSLRGIAEREEDLPPLIPGDEQNQVAETPTGAGKPIKEPMRGEGTGDLSADAPQVAQQGVTGALSQSPVDAKAPGDDRHLDSGAPLYPTYTLDSDVSSLLPVPAFAGETIAIFHGTRSNPEE